jgi:hypothetical protein
MDPLSDAPSSFDAAPLATRRVVCCVSLVSLLELSSETLGDWDSGVDDDDEEIDLAFDCWLETQIRWVSGKEGLDIRRLTDIVFEGVTYAAFGLPTTTSISPDFRRWATRPGVKVITGTQIRVNPRLQDLSTREWRTVAALFRHFDASREDMFVAMDARLPIRLPSVLTSGLGQDTVRDAMRRLYLNGSPFLPVSPGQ